MGKVACAGCDKMMSEQAVVCPHCGARQAERDPLPEERELDRKSGRTKRARSELSKEEAVALVAAEAKLKAEQAPRGLFAGLLLPSPRSGGAMWWAEVTLTVVGLPLVVGAALALVGLGRAVKGLAREQVSDLTNTALALGPGNLGLYFLLDAVGVERAGVWLIPPSLAVLLRTVIRALARER